MRKITALLGIQDGSSGLSDNPMNRSAARVPKISSETATALADAHCQTDGETEEDDLNLGKEMVETTTPISAIRDHGARLIVGEDDDESDAFPIPLRTRKGKETFRAAGTKRKR